MSTLTAGQLVNLRTKAHRSSFYLSVFQPATLLSALVNNGAITRGARSIAYDTGTGTAGQFATIEAYQLLEVDTSTGTEYVRVKSISGNETTGTITVDENGINWGNNNPIRIKHFYPLVAIPPSIRSGTFYKFYDIPYNASQNSTPNPVAIIGPHLVGVLSAGSVAFSLNSSSSYAIAQGATISSRAWSCLHNGGGVTGIAFSSAIAANPTLTITEAGQYWLKCVVTDSNGKTQATHRAIFTYSTLEDAYTDFTVSSISGDWNLGGWQASVEVTGAVALSDFPDGALAVIHYKNYFDATEGYVDLWGTAGQNIALAGYIRRDQDNDNFDDGTGKVSFDITTPDGVMDNMSELGSISLNATASPNKWYQYASWLTVGRGVHHLLKWHSSVLETCDVLGLTDNTLGVKNIDFTEPSVLQMANGVAYQRGHFAKMTSSRLGRLYFVTDSQMLNTAGRAALDTVFTLTAADISGVVDVVRQPEAAASVADLDGFSFNGTTSTPFISIMPGYRESLISYGLPGYRGVSPISAKSQVLIDQTDSNEKVGRIFAQANNNPLEMRFTTPANYIGAFDIVPSIGWYNWGLADADLKRNTELSGRLLLCRNIGHQVDVQSGTVQTSVVFEPEAEGPDGIQGNYPVGYPTPVLRTPTWDEPVTIYSFLLAWDDTTATDGQARAGSAIGTLGAAVNAETTDTFYNAIAALSATQAVICYYDGTNGVCRVADISGTTVSLGVKATFNAGATAWISCAALSATQVIVTYRDEAAANVGKAIIVDVSGSTVTPASEVTFDVAAVLYTSVTRLTASKAMVAYRNNAGTNTGCVLDVAGSVITANAAATISGSSDYVSIAALDSTTAINAYRVASTGELIAASVVSIGTGFTLDNTVILDATNLAFDTRPGHPWIVKIDGTRVLVVYQIDTGNFEIRAIVVSFDGVTLSAGSSIQVSTSSVYDQYPCVALIETNKAIVLYDNTTNGKLRTLTIDGLVLTDNNDAVDFDSNTTDYTAIAALRAV